MKKFTFHLDSLLRLRKINEDRIKFELGELNTKKIKILTDINTCRDSIEYLFKQQEESLINDKKINIMGSISDGLAGNRAKIVQLKKNLEYLEYDISNKTNELVEAKGKVKVLENLKEKEYTKFMKRYKRKEQEKLEEQVNLWMINKGI